MPWPRGDYSASALPPHRFQPDSVAQRSASAGGSCRIEAIGPQSGAAYLMDTSALRSWNRRTWSECRQSPPSVRGIAPQCGMTDYADRPGLSFGWRLRQPHARYRTWPDGLHPDQSGATWTGSAGPAPGDPAPPPPHLDKLCPDGLLGTARPQRPHLDQVQSEGAYVRGLTSDRRYRAWSQPGSGSAPGAGPGRPGTTGWSPPRRTEGSRSGPRTKNWCESSTR